MGVRLLRLALFSPSREQCTAYSYLCLIKKKKHNVSARTVQRPPTVT